MSHTVRVDCPSCNACLNITVSLCKTPSPAQVEVPLPVSRETVKEEARTVARAKLEARFAEKKERAAMEAEDKKDPATEMHAYVDRMMEEARETAKTTTDTMYLPTLRSDINNKINEYNMKSGYKLAEEAYQLQIKIGDELQSLIESVYQRNSKSAKEGETFQQTLARQSKEAAKAKDDALPETNFVHEWLATNMKKRFKQLFTDYGKPGTSGIATHDRAFVMKVNKAYRKDKSIQETIPITKYIAISYNPHLKDVSFTIEARGSTLPPELS